MLVVRSQRTVGKTRRRPPCPVRVTVAIGKSKRACDKSSSGGAGRPSVYFLTSLRSLRA